MKELYEVGDFVRVYINEQLIYGTIIELNENIAELNTKEYPSLTVRLESLYHSEQFPVGCVVKHIVTKRLYTITGIFPNGTYSTNIDVEVPHKNLEYAADLGDIVEFRGFDETNTLLGQVVKVNKSTGRITVRYTIADAIYKVTIDPIRIVNITSATDKLGSNNYSLKVNDNNNLFKVKNNENQLQKETNSVRRTDSSVGSRIYGRRPKAKISIGSLSYKARIGCN